MVNAMRLKITEIHKEGVRQTPRMYSMRACKLLALFFATVLAFSVSAAFDYVLCRKLKQRGFSAREISDAEWYIYEERRPLSEEEKATVQRLVAKAEKQKGRLLTESERKELEESSKTRSLTYEYVKPVFEALKECAKEIKEENRKYIRAIEESERTNKWLSDHSDQVMDVTKIIYWVVAGIFVGLVGGYLLGRSNAKDTKKPSEKPLADSRSDEEHGNGQTSSIQ